MYGSTTNSKKKHQQNQTTDCVYLLCVFKRNILYISTVTTATTNINDLRIILIRNFSKIYMRTADSMKDHSTVPCKYHLSNYDMINFQFSRNWFVERHFRRFQRSMSNHFYSRAIHTMCTHHLCNSNHIWFYIFSLSHFMCASIAF